jgi:hypothetical protein
LFDKEVESLKSEISKIYYHRLIAKAILFKEIDKIVMKKALGGYKANMVSYIIAWLSYKSNKKLNLESIWEQQKCSQNLYRVIDKMIEIVWNHINNPKKAGMNIGEWCKKQECWMELKDKSIDAEELKLEIKEGGEYEDGDNLGQELNPAEIKLINELKSISPEMWFELAKWAKRQNELTPFDRKLVYNVGVLVGRKAPVSIKQTKLVLKILKTAMDRGFIRES